MRLIAQLVRQLPIQRLQPPCPMFPLYLPHFLSNPSAVLSIKNILSKNFNFDLIQMFLSWSSVGKFLIIQNKLDLGEKKYTATDSESWTVLKDEHITWFSFWGSNTDTMSHPLVSHTDAPSSTILLFVGICSGCLHCLWVFNTTLFSDWNLQDIIQQQGNAMALYWRTIACRYFT